MKKLTKMLLGSAFMLSSALLMAQPSASSLPSLNSAAAGKINWLQTYSDAVAQSQSASKPIVILFTGTGWCPACMKLEREVISSPEFAQAVGDKFVFLKADFPNYSESAVSASPFKPLMDRYHVEAFPTLVVINANGQLLYTVNYRDGGPRAYAQELLQKLGQPGGMNSQNMQDNQGYYR